MSLVLEVVPPPLRLGDAGVDRVLADLAELLGSFPTLDAVNIPEIREEASKSAEGMRRNPFEPRVEPRRLAHRIQQELGLPAIVNHVVVHAPARAFLDWVRQSFEEYGISRFVLVGGERSDERYPGPGVCEANRLLADVLPRASISIGNICIPGRRSSVPERDRVAAKLAAGADFFTSQVLFHADELSEFLAGVPAHMGRASQIPILVSLCPLRSAKSVDFLRFLGVRIDAALAACLLGGPRGPLEASIDHIEALLSAALREHDAALSGVRIGVNVAPIGRVPTAVTAELLRRASVLLDRGHAAGAAS